MDAFALGLIAPYKLTQRVRGVDWLIEDGEAGTAHYCAIYERIRIDYTACVSDHRHHRALRGVRFHQGTGHRHELAILAGKGGRFLAYVRLLRRQGE